MFTAFSRENPVEKVYVQHLLRQHSAELQNLILRQGARVYVCRDAYRMAKDVFRTMKEIISGDYQLPDRVESAEEYLKEMKSQGRWVEDVW
jgi:sulfite reductase alpha subunit-like flavoprotein